jgi:DhnA family fructose-bisphosphate aldolase class Ia
VSFVSQVALDPAQYHRITDRRISDPTASLWAGTERRRRDILAPGGRLVLIAADHPARGVNAARGLPMAMADRRDLLARIVAILQAGLADGVMASMDVLEDLLLLHQLCEEDGTEGMLHDKVLVASMNRGGLADTCWEMTDPVTGASAEACARQGMDGGKLLLRLCPSDPGTLRTIEACAQAVTELNLRRLACFLEPLPVRRTDEGFEVIHDAAEIARAVGVAQALGDSSHGMWLKLPWCEDFGAVAASTTLPILLLGGPGGAGAPPFERQLADAMAAACNVRGVMVGRSLLYPADGDPVAAARTIHSLVHGGG